MTSEKKKIVCCIDDEPSIPNIVETLVKRRNDPGVHFFHLKVGDADSNVKLSDEPVSIPAALERGERISSPLSITGVIKTIEGIDKDELEILFVCDLRLDNVRWPIDSDEANDFDKKLDVSVEKGLFYPQVRPGIYALYKITQHEFNYVLTSGNSVRPEFTDLPINQPLGSSNAKPETVSKMVERYYTKEFGINSTWYNLFTDNFELLTHLNERLAAQPFMNDERHNVENIIKLKNRIDTEILDVCRSLLEELGAIDEDVADAQNKLDKPDSLSRALGIAKTVAVLRRIEPKTYLFDLLDIVRRKPQHEVEVDEDVVKNMDDLRSLIHSDITLPLSRGIARLTELFKEHADTEFFWHHRVKLNVPDDDSKMRCVYEVEIIPNTSKNYPINLSKIMREGSGNGTRTYQMMIRLFPNQDLRLIPVQHDFQTEISQLPRQGLFMLVQQFDKKYFIRLFGRREFSAA